MDSIYRKMAELSPEKRKLFLRMLEKEGVDIKKYIIPGDRNRDSYPLSFAQERLWFLEQFNPGSAIYTVPGSVRLMGPLDIPALEKSINRIVSRHETLRTAFASEEGKPVQIIRPRLDISIPLEDYSHLPPEQREEKLLQFALRETGRPFDLSGGPLIRANLVRLSSTEHVLILGIHHIVSDGWSLGVFFRELYRLYQSYTRGEQCRLPELPVQYVDFAMWQRDWLQGKVLEEQLSYWRDSLEGVPETLDLPTDYSRPAVQSYRGGGVTMMLSGELSERLRKLSREEGVTLFMTLMAAFQLILYRYSGQNDFSVGSPIANRNRAEIENLIGFFVNTLVLRAGLSGNPAFVELLSRVREVALGAFAHQDIPFEKLLQELRPSRDISRTPFFTVFFNMINFPEKKKEKLAGLTVENYLLPEASSNFDITLYASGGSEQIQFYLIYNRDIFARESMMEMLDQLGILLNQVCSDPSRRIDDYSLVTGRSREVLPDPAKPLSRRWEGAVCHLMSEWARREPEEEAVCDYQSSWSYRELDDASGRLANLLIEEGIVKGDVVAVYAQRSSSLVLALMGIMKAGAAFLILDPAYPPSRLISYMGRSRPRGFIRIEEAGGLPPEMNDYIQNNGPPVRLDLSGSRESIKHLLEDYQSRDPGMEIGPDDTACVAFTSGSTGQPKGIVGRHGSLTHFIPSQLNRFGLGSSDRYSMLSGLSHDPLQREIFTPLCSGACICIPSPGKMGNPEKMMDWMNQEEITVSHLTPAMIQLLSRVNENHTGATTTVDSLGSAFVTGDVLTREDVSRLKALAPGVSCVNFYGSTETQRAVGFYQVEMGNEKKNGRKGDEVKPREVIPLGRGLEDVQLLVLNRSGRMAGIGEKGEIWMRSPHLAAGYLGNEQLTHEVFRANPFTGDPGDRIYRTGDRGCYRSDGNVVFQGRLDEQLKIRGYRIEPSEIEGVLRRHTGISDSVIVARGEEPGNRSLVAYVVPEGGSEPGVSELREMLMDQLPAHMIPSSFVFIDRIPLTPNQKIDKDALPSPGGEGKSLEGEYVSPWTPTEDVLAGIWANVLGVDRVGVYHNFFDLGGHSLLATRIVSRVWDVFRVDLPLMVFFREPAVAAIAGYIDIKQREEELSQAPPLVPVDRDGNLPLSFSQQRLWFLDKLVPGNPAYNIPAVLKFEGNLSVEALERAVDEVIRRQESLRTTFTSQDGQPVQAINEDVDFSLPLISLDDLPPEERQKRVDELAGEEAGHRFDLTEGPLFRTTLIRVEEEKYVLLLNMHHIISDGLSMSVLIREIAQLYRSFLQDEPYPLRDLPIQYADFASWQRKWLQGEELEKHLSYWRVKLGSNPPVLEIPKDKPRPPVQSFRGGKIAFQLSQDICNRLRELVKSEECTLFMALLAAFKVLMLRYSGQTTVNVGTPIANRSRTETEKLIGFFVNTLVMSTDMSGNPGFRQLLSGVRDVALEAYTHKDLPFEKCVEELNPERDLSHSPLFQVMFVIQNVAREPLVFPGVRVKSQKVDSETSKFDLTLSMVDSERSLTGFLEYNSDLFQRSTAERMLEHYRLILERILEDPDTGIENIPLLPEPERDTILKKWSRGARREKKFRLVHRAFRQRAAGHPRKTAVVSGDEQISYGELDERSGRLANYLRKRGAGPESRIGILMNRSPGMMTAILGVLKAGSAYVPLAPNHPSRRLSFMVEDSGVSLILTEGELDRNLNGVDVDIVRMDRSREEIECCSGDMPPARITPESLAYLIYTSGTTGKPKGVMVPHRALANYLSWAVDYYRVDGGKTLSHSSLQFDLSITEIMVPLLSGGTVILAREWENIAQLADILRLNRGLSLLKLTPAHLEYFNTEFTDEEINGLASMLVAGGEQLYRRQISRWMENNPGIRIVNEYGPTETVVGCCVYQAAVEEREAVPVGKPVSNVDLYILDRFMQPVPVGVPGDLYIGGESVSRGYLNRPAATAESFVPDPFGGEGKRLYRSGDMARFLPDGEIEFLGRRDDQVKVRGFRIELGEIENVLSRHPEVREAAVAVKQREGGSGFLAAYVVPEEGDSTDISALRNYLKDKLPDYMIPPVFTTIDKVPLSSSGKVDRRSLPVPEITHPGEREVTGARNPVEEKLVNIWRRVLGLEDVGINDNFFELGGDSIISIQIIARANQEGIKLTPRDIFQQQTVAGLASVAGVREDIIDAEQGDITGPVPLTPVQHWFFEQDIPYPDYYNQTLLLRANRSLETELLQESLNIVTSHHDALRLRFRREEGQWKQYHVLHGDHAGVTEFDLSGLPDDLRWAAFRDYAGRIQGELDISEGPVWKAGIFHTGEEAPGRLLLVMHHLVMDGISRRILLEDLRRVYDSLEGGERPRLPAKTTSFKAWSENLRELAASRRMREQISYWLNLPWNSLEELPVDHRGGSNREKYSHTLKTGMSEELTGALIREVPENYNARINDIMMTALVRTLAGWTGNYTLLVDMEGHGREDLFDNVDISRTVGWFTSIYPAVLRIEPGSEPGESIKSVKEQLRKIPDNGIGFGLLRYLNPDDQVREALRDLPGAEVSFNYLGRFDQKDTVREDFVITGGPTGSPIHPETERRHLLEINAVAARNRLQVSWIYSRDIFEQSTVEKLSGDYIKELEGIIQYCRTSGDTGYTPGDFEGVNLDQDELDDALREIEGGDE